MTLNTELQLLTKQHLTPQLQDDKVLQLFLKGVNTLIEKKQAEINNYIENEACLNKTNQLLTTLFSKLHSGIVAEDENRNIVFTNQMYCDIFSIPELPEELRGVNCSDSGGKMQELFTRPVSYVAEINKLLHFKQPAVEQLLEMKNGKFYERNFTPIYINNEFKGALWKYTDVTEKVGIQKELKRSEENYRNMIEHATDIIYKTNSKGCFIFVNPIAERITGYSKEELYNMHFLDLIKEDYKSVAAKFYGNQVKQKKSSTYFEFPIISKKGHEVWIGQSVQFSQLDAYSEDYELTSLAIDITKQKLAETAIKESNQKLTLLQSLIDNSSDSIQVTKENGNLFYINKEASNILGIPVEDVKEFKVSDFVTRFKDNSLWEQHVDDLKQKDVLTIESTNVNQITRKEFPIEVTLRYISIDGNGYIIANSRDITARKHVENLLKKQEAKYRNIIANMNLGLIEVSPTEEILYANLGFCKMSGYSKEELIGRKASDFFMLDEHLDLLKDKAKLRESGVSDMYQLPARNKQGEIRWWTVSGAPNFDDSGEFIGSIGIHLDVTDQKKLERDLEASKIKAEEASKAKETFLANMSHEIRTPLNAIIGMIRELGKEELSASQKVYVENSSVASKHLLSIINNVLDISKIEAGELTLEDEHFKLDQAVNTVLSIMSSRAEEKGIYLSSEFSEDIHETLIGDPLRIEQILINLIGNAIKFTAKGGIHIKCSLLKNSKDQQKICIAVSDTGVGMDETYLKNVFKKFSQEDKSVSRKYGGTGLGLAITFELVQLMKGEIEVESEKNIGSTFNVIITLKKGSADELENKLKSTEEISIDGIKILLVEDNELNRMVAQNTFKYYKCEVDEAVNGLEALEKLKLKQYDIILMDIQMPEMDGLQATGKIRNELKLNTPIIALTANAFKSEIEKCKIAGMNDYLTKPFEEDALLKLISKYTSASEPVIQIQEVIKPNEANLKLYDLSKLKTLSRGDTEFINKMITLFIDQAKLSLNEINTAYSKKEFEAIHKVAHRLKPSIDNMCIDSLKKDIREIELLCKEQTSSGKIPLLITNLNIILNKVIQELSSELV